MKASDLVYETVSALRANRVRSLLTILGVVIGISAVIAMTALIGGIKMSLVGEMGLSQARLVTINYWGERKIYMNDIDAMAKELSDDFETVLPMATTSSNVNSATKGLQGSIYGTKPSYFEVMNLNVVQGQCFSEEDYEDGDQLVLLDELGAKNLFGSDSANAVGKTLRIGSSEYRIVGIVEKSGNDRGNESVNVYMPFTTLSQRITASSSIETVFAMARSEDDMDGVASRTKQWFTKRLSLTKEMAENDLWVTTSKSIIDELNTMMSSFQALMTVVASVSLVVGGIGIMNMMLTNVTERIREIGLRKALGARAKDITRQFLLESIFLTLSGGIIGIVVGYFGSYGIASLVVNAVNMTSGSSVTPVLDLQTMLLVTAICIGIGVVFGYYPARQAAKLDPVESLHYQ